MLVTMAPWSMLDGQRTSQHIWAWSRMIEMSQSGFSATQISACVCVWLMLHTHTITHTHTPHTHNIYIYLMFHPTNSDDPTWKVDFWDVMWHAAGPNSSKFMRVKPVFFKVPLLSNHLCFLMGRTGQNHRLPKNRRPHMLHVCNINLQFGDWVKCSIFIPPSSMWGHVLPAILQVRLQVAAAKCVLPQC